MRRVLAFAEYDVSPDSVGQGIHSSCGFGRARIGVNSDMAEIMAEARLEKSTRRRIQRLPRRTQYVVHDRRHVCWFGSAGCVPLQHLILSLTLFTLSTRNRVLAAITLSL